MIAFATHLSFFLHIAFFTAETCSTAKTIRGLASSMELKPKAILIITAHWETSGSISVSSGASPKLYFDYYGEGKAETRRGAGR